MDNDAIVDAEVRETKERIRKLLDFGWLILIVFVILGFLLVLAGTLWEKLKLF